MSPVSDPAAALAPMAETLALDGYQLSVEVVEPAGPGTSPTVRLVVVAGEDACEECLVPEELFASIAANALGPGWTVDVRYPKK